MKTYKLIDVVKEIKYALYHSSDNNSNDLINALCWTARKIKYNELIYIIDLLIDDISFWKKIIIKISIKFNKKHDNNITIFYNILMNIKKSYSINGYIKPSLLITKYNN